MELSNAILYHSVFKIFLDDKTVDLLEKMSDICYLLCLLRRSGVINFLSLFVSAALILCEIEALDKEYPAIMSENKDMVNFQRCRNFTRAIQHIQRYQSIPYHFHAIEVNLSPST